MMTVLNIQRLMSSSIFRLRFWAMVGGSENSELAKLAKSRNPEKLETVQRSRGYKFRQ